DERAHLLVGGAWLIGRLDDSADAHDRRQAGLYVDVRCVVLNPEPQQLLKVHVSPELEAKCAPRAYRGSGWTERNDQPGSRRRTAAGWSAEGLSKNYLHSLVSQC